MIDLKVNGETRRVDIDPDTPLLWALRDALNLKGTKFGCGAGLCGACTVHVNGAAIRSCTYPVVAAIGAEITTIEGLDRDEDHIIQQAWVQEAVPQCGYCQSGMMMAAAAFLADNPSPTSDEIKQGVTNICRCGTYNRIKKAIHAAADAKSQGLAEE